MRVARKYAIVAISLLVLAVCIPRRTYLSPAYDVTVVDNSGKALPGLRVRRFLQDYSRGTDTNYSSEAVTDSAGRAHFVGSSQWISFARETLGCISEILKSGPHAGCGSYVDVSVDASHFIETGRREAAEMDAGHRTSLTITLSPCPSGDWYACTEAPHKGTTSPGNQ
jgi:hypothetical protein